MQAQTPFNPNVKDGRATKGLAVNKSHWANTLDTPPFEAYAVTCGITFTFGGLRINTGAQVLSTDCEPIPGLYAAGELVGGIFYFNYPGGTGLTNGAVFGRIAGANAGGFSTLGCFFITRTTLSQSSAACSESRPLVSTVCPKSEHASNNSP